MVMEKRKYVICVKCKRKYLDVNNEGCWHCTAKAKLSATQLLYRSDLKIELADKNAIVINVRYRSDMGLRWASVSVTLDEIVEVIKKATANAT